MLPRHKTAVDTQWTNESANTGEARLTKTCASQTKKMAEACEAHLTQLPDLSRAPLGAAGYQAAFGGPGAEQSRPT